MITISLLSLMGMGILPNTPITRYSFLLGSFVEIILFSLLLAYRIDITQKKYQADLKREIATQTIHINKKNIVLQKLLRKKEELLKEMFHRVKNNFQILISMLYLEINNEKSALVNQKVERVIHKLHSMSIVHDMLYANSKNTTVDAKEYFEKLASHLIMKDTEIIVKVQSFEMDEQVAKNLGLIVNELFINSVKYTSPEDKNKIYLSVSYDENRVYFEYLDNTHGYAQGVQKGYGTQFIKEIIDKLSNSSFALDTKDKVHYKVSFTL